MNQLKGLFVAISLLLYFGFIPQHVFSHGSRKVEKVKKRSVTIKKKRYDYVVIGSGVGGSITASRLAEKGYSVLVMEAGANNKPVVSKVPAFHPLASESKDVALDYSVQHYGNSGQAGKDPKYDKKKKGILYPRGEGPGGSGNNNAMFTFKPGPGDMGKIATLTGDRSWSDKNMLKYWLKIENNRYRPVLRWLDKLGRGLGIKSIQNIGGHGFDGWLDVSRPSYGFLFRAIVRDKQIRKHAIATVKVLFQRERKKNGLAKTLFRLARRFIWHGGDINDDRLLKADPEGMFFPPLAVTPEGRRNSPRDLLEHALQKFSDRLELACSTVGIKVLFNEKKEATGVEYMQGENLLEADDEEAGQDRVKGTVSVNKGVILAGGTFETPKMLKLSGIGPKDELERFGIQVVHDQPLVGQNLQDRYEVGVVRKNKENIALLEGATFAENSRDPHFKIWKEGKEGLYSTNGAVTIYMTRSTKAPEGNPDVVTFDVPGPFPGYYEGYSKEIGKDLRKVTSVILKAYTTNRKGTVHLESNDPLAHPRINFRYFGEGKELKGDREDADAVAEAIKLARKINKASGIVKEEVLPGPDVSSDEALGEFVRNHAWGHHATGTAAIGPEGNGVLDSKLRVQGVTGLSVVDMSIFPKIIGWFPWAPLAMAAEKFAAEIPEK